MNEKLLESQYMIASESIHFCNKRYKFPKASILESISEETDSILTILNLLIPAELTKQVMLDTKDMIQSLYGL